MKRLGKQIAVRRSTDRASISLHILAAITYFPGTPRYTSLYRCIMNKVFNDLTVK